MTHVVLPLLILRAAAPSAPNADSRPPEQSTRETAGRYGPAAAGARPQVPAPGSRPQAPGVGVRDAGPAGHRGGVPALPDSVPDAARDLLLGSACVGCATPGRVLCRVCETTLPRGGSAAWPTPTPPGLALPFAAGPYDGLLKALVNAHKEHAVHALAVPLGRVLADVVRDLLAAHARTTGPVTGPVLIVPVPSRRAVVRSRGHDPLLRVGRRAAVRLRRTGVDARVRQALVPVGRVRDQARLDAAARAANLAGSMRARRLRTGDSRAGSWWSTTCSRRGRRPARRSGRWRRPGWP